MGIRNELKWLRMEFSDDFYPEDKFGEQQQKVFFFFSLLLCTH
jgi:hypothetical protein